MKMNPNLESEGHQDGDEGVVHAECDNGLLDYSGKRCAWYV